MPACTTCADEKIVILDEDDETESDEFEETHHHPMENLPKKQLGKEAEVRGIRVTTSEEMISEPIETPQKANEVVLQENNPPLEEPTIVRNLEQHEFPVETISNEDRLISEQKDDHFIGKTGMVWYF